MTNSLTSLNTIYPSFAQQTSEISQKNSINIQVKQLYSTEILQICTVSSVQDSNEFTGICIFIALRLLTLFVAQIKKDLCKTTYQYMCTNMHMCSHQWDIVWIVTQRPSRSQKSLRFFQANILINNIIEPCINKQT